MTAKEILFKHIPKDCFWEEGGNLDNCPLKYVIAAMEEYWWVKDPEMTIPDWSLKKFSLPNSEQKVQASVATMPPKEPNADKQK